MTRIIETRNGDRQNFDTVLPDTILEMHVDGIGDMSISGLTCKVTLFQVRAQDPIAAVNQIERREAVMILSMQLPVLIESFSNVLKGIALNHAPLQSGVDQGYKKTKELLEQLAASVPPDAK
jgi:hypothetical protein